MKGGTNYSTMLAYWESITPVRGHDADVRPIGGRRKNTEAIRKDAVDDSVCAVLRGVDGVRYYPDGSVGLRCDGRLSPTFAEFLQRWSPTTCWVRRRGHRLWIALPTSWMADQYLWHPVPLYGELRLVPVPDVTPKVWTVLQAPTVRVLTRNRQAVRDARAPAVAFLRWAKALLAIADYILVWDAATKPPARIPLSKETLADEAMWPEMLRQVVAYSGCISGYNGPQVRVHFSTLKAYVYKELERPVGDALYDSALWVPTDTLPKGRMQVIG